MSRSSIDGSDFFAKPTLAYRYIIKNDALQNAANNLQPIIRFSIYLFFTNLSNVSIN